MTEEFSNSSLPEPESDEAVSSNAAQIQPDVLVDADNEAFSGKVNDVEGEMIEISVSDPFKQGDSISAYVSYRVSTKTNLPQYRWSQFSVIRRYRDFEWLFDRLHNKNPGVIIPGLPEKTVKAKYSFDTNFIEKRRRALQAFLNRCGNHPRLRNSVDLQTFLEASDEIWSKETSIRDNTALSKRADKMGARFKGLKASLSIALDRRPASKEGDSSNGMKQFQEVFEEDAYIQFCEYVSHLKDILSSIADHVEIFIKKQREASDCLSKFAESLASLGENEGAALSDAVNNVSTKGEEISQHLLSTADRVEIELEEPIHHILRQIVSIKRTIFEREAVFLKFKTENENLYAKRLKLQRLQSNKDIHADKVSQAQKEEAEAQRTFENAQQYYADMKERMAEEIARFHADKTKEVGIIMRSFAALQQDSSGQAHNVWSNLVDDMESLLL